MSLRERTQEARALFGPDATVTERSDGWRVLSVPGHEPLRIGRNDSEARNALKLAGVAGGLGALRDGVRLPNPSWRSKNKKQARDGEET